MGIVSFWLYHKETDLQRLSNIFKFTKLVSGKSKDIWTQICPALELELYS